MHSRSCGNFNKSFPHHDKCNPQGKHPNSIGADLNVSIGMRASKLWWRSLSQLSWSSWLPKEECNRWTNHWDDESTAVKGGLNILCKQQRTQYLDPPTPHQKKDQLNHSLINWRHLQLITDINMERRWSPKRPCSTLHQTEVSEHERVAEETKWEDSEEDSQGQQELDPSSFRREALQSQNWWVCQPYQWEWSSRTSQPTLQSWNWWVCQPYQCQPPPESLSRFQEFNVNSVKEVAEGEVKTHPDQVHAIWRNPPICHIKLHNKDHN